MTTIRLRDLMMGELGSLRYEPTQKRIRAELGGAPVIDSTRALLLWEPRRVVPTYAVPREDISAELGPGTSVAPTDDQGLAAMGAPQLGDRAVLDPSIPFAVHTAPGEAVTVRAGGAEAAAFQLADPDLEGYLALDFDAFDAWYEEDEPNVAHPRDPFHRIDIVHSSRHVRVELDGRTLAESTRPILLFEEPLPVRFYLPREDVRTDLLAPSDTRTSCAYKGRASYLSLPDAQDVAWTYPEPLREAAEVQGRIAFFNERVDVVVDGEPLERPITPWSPR
jgi:uncharacterized protein (DUF427 family)